MAHPTHDVKDEQLKLELARILPEQLFARKHNRYDSVSGEHILIGHNIEWKLNHELVKDTEWLHVCWLVEHGLNIIELTNYGTELNRMTVVGEGNDPLICHQCCFHKSWQQRAIALCRVKGVAI